MSARKHIADKSVNVLLADFRQQIGDKAAMATRSGKFPNDLERFIERAGIKRAELARLAKTSRQQIHDLAAGHRELTVPWARRLAPHLGVSPAELLGVAQPGMADPQAHFTAPAPAGGRHDDDQVLAMTQEEVAAQLLAAELPRKQADILAVSRAVLNDIEALGELPQFPATLALRTSETISKLLGKWADAKASLHARD